MVHAGFPFAFGIFQEYYRTHEPFAGSSKTAIIGTCAMVGKTLNGSCTGKPFC
jgi:hypothetical protein